MTLIEVLAALAILGGLLVAMVTTKVHTVRQQHQSRQALIAAEVLDELLTTWIDPETGGVWVDAQPVEPPLSDRQHTLLELLVERAGALISREEVIDTVWA
ncbi:MAG: hypothetical protein AAGL98_14430, partial [Planctomycetota bacterium]